MKAHKFDLLDPQVRILPEDTDRAKMVLGFSFGFFLLAVYFVLAISIALGHVEEKTSYGLREVLMSLGPLGGLFAGWAFGVSQTAKKE